MQQLTQKRKDGKMQVIEVPMPVLQPGCVLVRNHYSLISAGTEGSTVQTARKSLIGKAKERPQQVKQVADVVMSQGLTQAYRAVMKKLDVYSPLGYSSAGEVIDVGEGVSEFSGGLGCDAVIITAGTDSLDPINFAGAIARKKGTVVIVGSVPTGFD